MLTFTELLPLSSMLSHSHQMIILTKLFISTVLDLFYRLYLNDWEMLLTSTKLLMFSNRLSHSHQMIILTKLCVSTILDSPYRLCLED